MTNYREILRLAALGFSQQDMAYNSSEDSLQQVEKITGKPVQLYNADIRDRAALEDIFASNEFDCVIHFAGLKAVGESVVKPWEYYDNNVNGTLVLLDVMRQHGCKNMIFSSSERTDPAERRLRSLPKKSWTMPERTATSPRVRRYAMPYLLLPCSSL